MSDQVDHFPQIVRFTDLHIVDTYIMNDTCLICVVFKK